MLKEKKSYILSFFSPQNILMGMDREGVQVFSPQLKKLIMNLAGESETPKLGAEWHRKEEAFKLKTMHGIHNNCVDMGGILKRDWDEICNF